MPASPTQPYSRQQLHTLLQPQLQRWATARNVSHALSTFVPLPES